MRNLVEEAAFWDCSLVQFLLILTTLSENLARGDGLMDKVIDYATMRAESVLDLQHPRERTVSYSSTPVRMRVFTIALWYYVSLIATLPLETAA